MAGDRLRIICGPTATGKSDLALALCETYNAAIVSADSRQIYCEFNVGTAKPTREECARVTHYGIDVAEPEERYSAARWANDANEWIESAAEIEKEAVIVGGTGLYIRAIVDPLFSAPDHDPVQRAKLERLMATMSVDDLRRWCRELDPARAHLGRTQLLRALETALLSGARISDLHSRHNAAAEIDGDRQKPAYLVVDPGDHLGARIEARVDRMLGMGWAEEVRELMSAVSPEAPAWKASGYMVMRRHIEGALDLSSATQRVIIETRQYAKRQRTWFRNQLPRAAVTHVNPDDPHALTIAREWWETAE
ncbi:MAG: tRNA (adenosine(37)-N6)-dimethylallyltransferase MiaA [Gemmatimonadota bacterium]|nr:tRNA (adenosine(37)-N6)-dimethylallyltransferase MiaA [Gemmatimonadota bacterium]